MHVLIFFCLVLASALTSTVNSQREGRDQESPLSPTDELRSESWREDVKKFNDNKLAFLHSMNELLGRIAEGQNKSNLLLGNMLKLLKELVKKQQPEKIKEVKESKSTVKTARPTTPTPVNCESKTTNWTLISGNLCVVELQRWTNWTGADATCRRIGGTIFTFRNAEEVKAVKGYVRRRSYWFWVGHRYAGSQPQSAAGPSAYNPPRSMYASFDKRWRGRCAIVSVHKLSTRACSTSHGYTLCRKLPSS